ncbi:unnamed protein product [Heligmosomoides polygyrus]|uniref:Endo/exonuclease/phosphatase domain-containing protein n=1 Tax=Heligmosomoides polygyrus TaxID=6339 RepID=A0A183F8V6_HELPZ|nr:unnamed protein product [Heligmosomoides polygyrus]
MNRASGLRAMSGVDYCPSAEPRRRPTPCRGALTTWESPGGQFHNEIDHIIFNRKYCLTDVSVVPKFYTESDHRLLRARFRFLRRGKKAVNFKKRSHRTTINWDLHTTLAGLWEDTVMDNIDEEYDHFVPAIVLREPRA